MSSEECIGLNEEYLAHNYDLSKGNGNGNGRSVEDNGSINHHSS